MNIYILDPNPVKAASLIYVSHRLQAMKHLSYIMSSVVRTNCPTGYDRSIFYSYECEKHACTQWVAASMSNFFWTLDMFSELVLEFNNTHKRDYEGTDLLVAMRQIHLDFDEVVLTDPPQVMQEKYRGENPVAAYLEYYANEKGHHHNKDVDEIKIGKERQLSAPLFPVGSFHSQILM